MSAQPRVRSRARSHPGTVTSPTAPRTRRAAAPAMLRPAVPATIRPAAPGTPRVAASALIHGKA
jgi:hypothetical protein